MEYFYVHQSRTDGLMVSFGNSALMLEEMNGSAAALQTSEGLPYSS